jgi:phospholipase C
MPEIPRREVIRGVAASAALSALPRSVRAQHAAKLTDIDHIIILMKENRSFDHYFGTLSGVRGFADPKPLQLADDRTVFHQPDGDHPDGFVLPLHMDTARTSAQRLNQLNHSWNALHNCWNGGKMDRWIPVHRAIDGAVAPLTMGYFRRADIPFYFALADAFTICDGYHASMMGPTHPNRYLFWSGTIDPEGKFGGPALDNRRRSYSWESYPERLERGGISWRIYHEADDYGCNVCRFLTQYQDLPTSSPLYENALRNRSFDELLADLCSGDIPQVTWIVPPPEVTEHPDYLPAAGEHHAQQILAALWSNPSLWARTAFILNYDENDGFFDHVPPPVPEPGTPGEFVRDLPVGLGFRVPCLVISPMSRGGYVCSETFDHTSTLRLIEARFGVEIPYLSAWRRQTCGDLTRAFGFGDSPDLDVPKMPDTAETLRRVEANLDQLPRPTVPERQMMPEVEPGSRRRRATT